MMVEVTTVRALEVILSRLKMDGETARIMREHLVSERLAQREKKPTVEKSGVCVCCGERPIASPQWEECIEYYTANTSEGS
ncbi:MULTISPECIES: hypothetical protein [Sulfitobacter]|uniref:hypothetical protein n=1 Tax=Sulfitobacter TaxID=60136 RepID=UPI0024581FA2|nr:hypothetical protein [Sulfitobacter faviae]MDH4541027.1 hypothetical protein [Sulfitobacter faviae]